MPCQRQDNIGGASDRPGPAHVRGTKAREAGGWKYSGTHQYCGVSARAKYFVPAVRHLGGRSNWGDSRRQGARIALPVGGCEWERARRDRARLGASLHREDGDRSWATHHSTPREGPSFRAAQLTAHDAHAVGARARGTARHSMVQGEDQEAGMGCPASVRPAWDNWSSGPSGRARCRPVASL